MTTKPCPVVITHPGCDVEPMRCGTCEHAEPYPDKRRTDVVDCGITGTWTYTISSCPLWRCRKFGGEIQR